MRKSLFTSLVLIGGFSPVIAAPPHAPNIYTGGNLWTITAYDDSAPAHTQWATQAICFLPPAVVGTHQRGSWYSLTFPDWNGTYSQEGDQVFIYGDYAKDVGHDGMQIDLDTARSASGHWKEWRENGAFGLTIGFANTRLERVGTCRTFTPTELPGINIPPRYSLSGREAQFPLERNQQPFELNALPYVVEVFK